MEQTTLKGKDGACLHWRLMYLHKEVHVAKRVSVLSEVATQAFCFVLGKYTFLLFNRRFECGTDVPGIKSGINR
jgi:hypothetical protein